jgi:LysM repeat protein
MDFEEMPEPNMKLSRALLIVLLLHVVAVSGIIAFNAIKTRENSFVPESRTEPAPSATADAAIHSDGKKQQPAVAQKERAPHEDPKPSDSPSKLSTTDDYVSAPPVARAILTKPVSSGATYVVKKGDNPVTIAKKLKVPYDDLMDLNHIEDPRKLRIGQKLLIPRTTKAASGNTAKPKEKKNEVRHTKQRAGST